MSLFNVSNRHARSKTSLQIKKKQRYVIYGICMCYVYEIPQQGEHQQHHHHKAISAGCSPTRDSKYNEMNISPAYIMTSKLTARVFFPLFTPPSSPLSTYPHPTALPLYRDQAVRM